VDIAVCLLALRLRLHIDKLWRLCKIMKQRRAQPAWCSLEEIMQGLVTAGALVALADGEVKSALNW
jgi:tellurite resistance protein